MRRGWPVSIIRASTTTSEKATPTVGTKSRTKSQPALPVESGLTYSAKSPTSDVALARRMYDLRRYPARGTKSVNNPYSGFSTQGMVSNAPNTAMTEASSPQDFRSERTGWAISPSVGSPIPWMKYIVPNRNPSPSVSRRGGQVLSTIAALKDRAQAVAGGKS